MLFDLRSRGRRRAVKVIYGFLALVMIAGLVLVGVGTGSSGGLLNAFTNNNGGGGGSSLADQELNQAIKAARKDPKSAGKWAALMQARWSTAGSGSNYNNTTKTYTAGGKRQLGYGADAWQQYLKITGDKPSIAYSQLAAGIYQALGQWSDEAIAWNYAAQTEAGSQQALTPYLCLALSSYAAKQTTKGDLAAVQAVKLTPKLQRLTWKGYFNQAKSSTSTAQSFLGTYC
jgi:hypothetical protein